jgi:protein-S-isoprenylcysteine O-methyltransferase Ste14
MTHTDSFLIRSGNFFFKYRDQAFPLLFGSIILLYPFIWGQQGTFMSTRWDLVALAIAFVGEMFRVVTVGLEYIIRGGLNKNVYAEDLVTEGMFRHCRNPLYVGNLLMVWALLLLTGNIWILAIGIVSILFIYISIVAAEEAFLRRKFGPQYDAYCAKVARWLPDFRGFSQTLASMEFNWRRVVVKEYSSVYFWSFSALTVLAYKTIWYYATTQSIAQATGILTGLALTWVFCTLAFLLVRFCKKTARLTETSFNLFGRPTDSKMAG